MEFITALQPYVLAVFVYSTMIYLGLGMTLGQIGATFKRWKLILIALGLNLILSPLLALAVGTVFGLASGALSAAILINLFCGSPGGAKNADLAGGEPTLAVALVAILSVAAIVVVPFTSRLLLPGIQVNPLQILVDLIVLLLVPISVGMVVRKLLPNIVKPVGKVAAVISNIFMVLVILCFLVPNIQNIVAAGIVNLLVFLLIIALSFGLSYLLTFGTVSERKTVSLVSITKNFGVAMSLAPVAFADEDIMPYVMTYVVVLLVFSLPCSLLLRKLKDKKAAAAQTPPEGVYNTIGKAGM